MSEKSTRDVLRLRSKAMTRDFVGDLYSRWLKPAGYRKAGHTFRRDTEFTRLEFQVQGSSWNGPPSGPLILSPWRPTWQFYVNVAVNLKPPQRTDGSPDGSFRLERILPEANRAWELTEGVVDQLADELGTLIIRADEMIAARVNKARSSGRTPVFDGFGFLRAD